MVHEPPNNLHRRGVVILNLMKLPFIERQDLRAWIPEQNWRVVGNDELCIFVLPENVMEQYQKKPTAAEERVPPQAHLARTSRCVGT